MGITALTVPTAHTASSEPAVARAESRGCERWSRRLGIAAAAAVVFISTDVSAQRWNLESSVRVSGTATSNDGLKPSGQEQFNVWLDISPRISLIGTGPGGRLRVSGDLDLGASLRTRLRGEDRFSLRPQGALNATLEAISGFFFVDAGASVQRNLESPFLATTDSTSPVNTFTSYQARLSPYIQGRLPGSFNYTVRSEYSWTDSGRTARQQLARHSASIERAPQPVGVALSASRTELSSQREGVPDRTTDVARAIVRYAPSAQYAFGARAGWERNNYLLSNASRTFYGFDGTWRPTERTNLTASWEDRFFGSSWQVSFAHRMPRLAFNIQASRTITSTPQQFATFPALANLVALLDAALTTRFPDPVERQRVIVDFLSRQQLPPELLTPTIIYDERVSLLNSISASLVMFGQRNSLAFSAFQSRTEGLTGTTTLLPPALANNVQRGFEVTYSRRLTPVTSLSSTASWRETEGLGDQSDRQTTQTVARVQINRRLGPRTNGFIGGRYQWVDSNVSNDATEAAVFFGLNHNFF